MDDKQAAKILINLLDKYPFDKNEKEAISNAIGILSWTCSAKPRKGGVNGKNKIHKTV